MNNHFMNNRNSRPSIALASFALAALTFTAYSPLAMAQDPAQQSTGDQVADAARKAREQKKKDTAKPKRVFTDDDVNHSTSTGVPGATETDAASTPEGGAAKNGNAQGKDAAGKAPEPEESPEVKWRK